MTDQEYENFKKDIETLQRTGKMNKRLKDRIAKEAEEGVEITFVSAPTKKGNH